MKVPYSPTQSVGIDPGTPAFDNRRGAPDEAFGAGVARSVQGLGQAVDRLGDSMTRLDILSKTDAVERDNLNRTTDYVQFQNQEQEFLTKMKREATGTDAIGFYDTYMKGLQERINARMATVRPQDKEKWNLEYEKMKAQQARSAFGSEMEIRDATQQTRVKGTFDTLGKQIEDDPTRRDIYIQNGYNAIDATNFPPAIKEQMKKNWKDMGTYVYGNAMAKRDPTAVAEALDPEGNYYRRLRGAESGTNDQARPVDPATGKPLSSAFGRYQFTTGTWNNVVNSPEGKAAGLTEGGRGDPDQQERAIRIFTKGNEKKLEAAGFEVNNANRYAMHFLGEGGGLKFLKEARENPAASAAGLLPAAASSNPTIFYRPDGSARTVADVYRLLAGKFGARGDTAMLASLKELPQKERAQLADAAERGVADEFRVQAKQQQEQWNSWFNSFQIQLSNGQAGTAEINNAIQAGQLTDYANIKAVRKIVEDRESKNYYATSGAAALQAPTAWNPFDPEQKKQINAVYEDQKSQDPTKNLGVGLNLWGKTKILPDEFASTLRGALISTDGATMKRALQVVSSMYTADNNAFASAGAARSDLENAAIAFNHRINNLGDNAQQAAAYIARMNDPEVKAKMKVKEEEVKRFKDEILKNTSSNITNVFTDPQASWLFNRSYSVGSGGRERAAITGIFTELAAESYAEHGDQRLAISAAQQKMNSMFGVTNGVLKQYPPEKAAGYPALPDGSKSYIYTQAAADIFERTGIKVDPKNITLAQIPYTAEAFRNGEPVPYALTFKREVNGQPIWETVNRSDGINPAPWTADFNKALEGWRAEIPKKMQEARTIPDPGYDNSMNQPGPMKPDKPPYERDFAAELGNRLDDRKIPIRVNRGPRSEGYIPSAAERRQ